MMTATHPTMSLKDSAVARLLIEGRLPDNYGSPHRVPLDLSSSQPFNGLDQDYRSDSGEPEVVMSPGDSWHPSMGTPETSPSPPLQYHVGTQGSPVYARTSRAITPDQPVRGANRRKRRPQQRKAPPTPPMPNPDPEDGSSSPSSSSSSWKCQYCPFTAKDTVTLYSHYQFHQQLLGSSYAGRSHMEWISAYQKDRYFDQKSYPTSSQMPEQDKSLHSEPHFRSIPESQGEDQRTSSLSPDPPCSGSPALRHLLQSHTLDVNSGRQGNTHQPNKIAPGGSASGFLRSIVQNIMQQGNNSSQTSSTGPGNESANSDGIYSNLLKNVADSQPWESSELSTNAKLQGSLFAGEERESYRNILFTAQKDTSPPGQNMSASRHLESLLKAGTIPDPCPIEIKPEPEDIGYNDTSNVPNVLVVQPEQPETSNESSHHSPPSSVHLQDPIRQQLKKLLTHKRQSPSNSQEPLVLPSASMTSATIETWSSPAIMTSSSAPSPSKRAAIDLPSAEPVDSPPAGLQSVTIGLQCSLCECFPDTMTTSSNCTQKSNNQSCNDNTSGANMGGMLSGTEQFSGKTPEGDSLVSVTNNHCKFCDICFGDAVIHSIHMGCHNAEDPFKCNVCNKPCGDKYSFYAHIMRGHQAV